MEIVELVVGLVIAIGTLIVVYNNMGTEEKPVKKDYGNEELSRAFARGCTKALWGDTKK